MGYVGKKLSSSFELKCKLAMQTNFIPTINDADRAFQKRLRVLPFKAKFATSGASEDGEN